MNQSYSIVSSKKKDFVERPLLSLCPFFCLFVAESLVFLRPQHLATDNDHHCEFARPKKTRVLR